MPLLLVRHGESEGNARGIMQGQREFPLTEHGHRQAAAVAERFRTETVHRLLSSPLGRAAATAAPIATALGIEAVEDIRLMEYDFGDASGLTFAEMVERYPHIGQARARGERPAYPGEEGIEPFRTRVRDAVHALGAGDEITVAVTHAGFINAALVSAFGFVEYRTVSRPVNCAITELAVDRAGRLVVRRLNDACHLEGLEALEPPRLS